MYSLNQLKDRSLLKQCFKDCLNNNKKNSIFLAFLDGNGLKKVNDTYGHLLGDLVVFKIIESILGSINLLNDYAIRYGGDEFIILFSNSTKREVESKILNIQKLLRTDKKLLEKIGPCTISAGIVEYNESKHKSINLLLEEADLLMYSAKKKPPYFMAFDKDIYKIFAEKRSAKAERARNYFSWIISQILLENPTWSLEILLVLTRRIWNSEKNILDIKPRRLIYIVEEAYKSKNIKKIA